MRRAAIALIVALSGPALAHDAPSGWAYDGWCCSSNDCAPIPASAVEITPEGFRVTLDPETHFTVRGEVVKTFAYDEVRQSGDEHYHACVLPASQEFRCLYVPKFTH